MKTYTFTDPGGDTDQGWALISVTWAFVVAALVSTILRVWVRGNLTRNMGADDWTMIVAMATTLLGAGLVTSEVVLGGLGRHAFYLSTRQLELFTAIGWADWIQTYITLLLTKVSICLFLQRIVDARKLRLALWGMIAFMTLFTAVCIFLFIGVCRPLSAYWTADASDAQCLTDQQLLDVILAQGICSIISDLICAAFPILFIRRLQIHFRTKLALCLLMGLGVITAACCTVRTAISGDCIQPDVTWTIVPNIAWRLPEVNIGIFCANAPIIRPLYLFFRGRLQSQGGKYSGGTNGISKDRFVLPQNMASAPSDKMLMGAGAAASMGKAGTSVNGTGSSFVSGSADEASGGWQSRELKTSKIGNVDEGVELEMGLPVEGVNT